MRADGSTLRHCEAQARIGSLFWPSAFGFSSSLLPSAWPGSGPGPLAALGSFVKAAGPGGCLALACLPDVGLPTALQRLRVRAALGIPRLSPIIQAAVLSSSHVPQPSTIPVG